MFGWLLAVQTPVLAGEPRLPAIAELEILYQRMEPGMTVAEVARAAGRQPVVAPGQPLTSWLVWTPPVTGRPVDVLRTSFRDGRLVRIEYESFGEEYRHLVKGDRRPEIDGDQMTRLWRRSVEVTETAEACGEALEAFHQLVIGLQERLRPAEQQAWVLALTLRRAAEPGLNSLSR
jgi:hypothetical protein